jgi:site-specific DNA recombinase
MKAIAYTRTAVREVSDQSHSINYQEIAIKDYCKENNIDLLHVFHDVGSGMNFEREDWKNLETYLADSKNDVRALIVTSFDRVGRNEEQVLFKMAVLEKRYNVQLVSISEKKAFTI